MSDPFDDPSGGMRIQDHKDRLLLCYPQQYLPQVQTKKYGMRDAVETRVVVLDGDGAPLELGQMRVFQSNLIGALRPKVGTGRPVLGRLVQGEAADADSKPPWLLEAGTDADKEVARKYLADVKAKEAASATTDPYA